MSTPSRQPQVILEMGSIDDDVEKISRVPQAVPSGSPPVIAVDSPHQLHNDVRSDPPLIEESKKPTVLSRAWSKLGINPTVAMIMVKPAVAAVISLAICQRLSVAKLFLNFGYLIIIVSITTVPILPRGKFLMNLAISLVSSIYYSISIKTDLAFSRF